MRDKRVIRLPTVDEVLPGHGYYWVRFGDSWQPALWDEESWWLIGSEEPVEKFGVEEIGEPIRRNLET